MADLLSLDTYVIARPPGFSLNVPYYVYDDKGTKLVQVKRALIGEVYTLTDTSGKALGTITRKMIAISPSYELRDANKAVIGKVVEPVNLAGSIMGGAKKFVLQDASGNEIASVQLTQSLAMMFETISGNAPNMSSEITSADGSKSIGRLGVSRSVNYSALASLLSRFSSFTLQITDKSISKLALIEFAIAVDHLYSSTGSRGMGMPGGMSFGAPGFGGGGMNIKL